MKLSGSSSNKKISGYRRGLVRNVSSVTRSGRVSNVYNVLHYGADATGAVDSTIAVRRAMNRANTAGGGTVFFPPGTYKMVPPATATVNVFKKVGGTYGSAIATEVATNQTVDGAVFFRSARPLESEGAAGNIGIDYLKGLVYRHTGSGWISDGKLVDHAGAGWYAYRRSPMDTVGQNGDYWFQFWIVPANPDFCSINLLATHINVTFSGSGVDNTTLVHRAWSDVDPMDYETYRVSPVLTGENIEGGDVIFLRGDGKWWKTNDGTYTKIGESVSKVLHFPTFGDFPANGESGSWFYVDDATENYYWWDSSAGIYKPSTNTIRITGLSHSKIPSLHSSMYGEMSRGAMFQFNTNNGLKALGIVFEKLHLYGGCTATGNTSWYSNYDRLLNWDISNKAIHFGGSGNLANTIIVRNCRLDYWRGEILYSGGGGNMTVKIEDCVVTDCNASALSSGGYVEVRRCDFRRVANAFENYSMDYTNPPQYTLVEDTVFDARDDGVGFEGGFNLAYLGDPNSWITVDRCSFYGGNSGVFLSEFASNVIIRNSKFYDQKLGAIYAIYLNQYGKPAVYNNILIEDNQVFATMRNMANFWLDYLGGGTVADLWTFRRNETVPQNGFKVNGSFIRSNVSRARPDHEVILDSNILNDVMHGLFGGDGIVPVYLNNVLTPPIPYDLWSYDAGGKTVQINNPFAKVTAWSYDAAPLVLSNVHKFPVGHTLQLSGNNLSKGPTLSPDVWNAFTEVYHVKGSVVLNLRVNEDNVWEAVT